MVGKPDKLLTSSVELETSAFMANIRVVFPANRLEIRIYNDGSDGLVNRAFVVD